MKAKYKKQTKSVKQYQYSCQKNEVKLHKNENNYLQMQNTTLSYTDLRKKNKWYAYTVSILCTHTLDILHNYWELYTVQYNCYKNSCAKYHFDIQ